LLTHWVPSYVFYLESRVEQLETLLQGHGIAFPSAEKLDNYIRPPGLATYSNDAGVSSQAAAMDGGAPAIHGDNGEGQHAQVAEQRAVPKSATRNLANLDKLGSVAGVSFARVVFAAVQSSVSDPKSSPADKTAARPHKAGPGGAPSAGDVSASASQGTSMRDSFFGLHTKPTIRPAVFPDRALALKLVELYFEHANPQIPVLHKDAFMQMFELAYAPEGAGRVRGPKELYMLNMVFAIGSGIIMGDHAKADAQTAMKQSQPEEYHASAIVHLEACLGSSGGGLAELQAVLLLANFALLRPVPPGLW
jgi:hypothetical protein